MFPLRDKIFADLDTLQSKTDNVEIVLQKNIELMTNYRNDYDKILSDLQKIEQTLNVKTRDLIQVTQIDAHISKSVELSSNVADLKSKIKTLKQSHKKLQKLDTKPNISNVKVLEDRVKTIEDNIITRSSKLNSVLELYTKYENKVDSMNAFLKENTAKLDEFEKAFNEGAKNTELLKSTLKDLKDFAQVKEQGIAQLNEIIELSESLFLELIPQNRDTMRVQLKGLRSGLEAWNEKWTLLLKKNESVVLQRASIEDSLHQVVQWISSVEGKIEKTPQLKEILPEKKKALNSYHTLLQDVQSHKTIIDQLNQKMKSLPESGTDGLVERYNQLHGGISSLVDVHEKYVLNHENYLNAFEKFKDFFDVLLAEENKSSKCDVDNQIGIYESIIQQDKTGDEMIKECEKLLKPVLAETNNTGKEALQGELNAQKKNWLKFLTKCKSFMESLIVKKGQAEKLQGRIASLDEFLKNTESKLKDQSLRNSLDAKKAYLDDMKNIYNELNEKISEFEELKKEASGANPELTEVIMKLVARYQNVKQKAKVGYRGFCVKFCSNVVSTFFFLLRNVSPDTRSLSRNTRALKMIIRTFWKNVINLNPKQRKIVNP